MNHCRMAYIIVIIFITVLVASCGKFHTAIHGTIVNISGIPNTRLVWKGTTECYGRSFFDINPWHDNGLKTSSSKAFTTCIRGDGSFTFPSSFFWSTLRKKEIHYSCSLLDSTGKTIGHVSSPLADGLIFYLYTKTIILNMVPGDRAIPSGIPQNIKIRIRLQDIFSGEYIEEISIQKFFDGYGHIFSEDQLVRGPLQSGACTVSLSIIDEYNKLRTLPILNEKDEVWRFNCDPASSLTISLPYKHIYDVLTAWPAKIDNGEAIKWAEAEDATRNPPDYFRVLKERIRKISDTSLP